MGCGVIIVSLRLPLREFRRDFNSAAPPHDRYCADSGSKRTYTAQTRASNEPILRRLGLQANLYCADSGFKRTYTAQTRAPSEPILRRLGLQTNLYCADSGSKRTYTAQTRASNEPILRRLGLQANLYCADSGSKRTYTVQTRAPSEPILRRLGLQITSFSQDDSSHSRNVLASLFYSGRKWKRIVHFFFFFFYSLWFRSVLLSELSHTGTCCTLLNEKLISERSPKLSSSVFKLHCFFPQLSVWIRSSRTTIWTRRMRLLWISWKRSWRWRPCSSRIWLTDWRKAVDSRLLKNSPLTMWTAE